MRFLKKTEFEFYTNKMKEKIDDLEALIDMQESRLEREISMKGEEYSLGCEIIEKRLVDHMKPVKNDMVILMKTRARQHSDDLIAQNRVLDRF